MVKIITILIFFDIVLFLYIILYAIILNILLIKNKSLIEECFDEKDYKLYIYDNKSGNIISRKIRLKVIEKLIKNNFETKNKKFFVFILKIFDSIYFVFALFLLFTFFLFYILFRIW